MVNQYKVVKGTRIAMYPQLDDLARGSFDDAMHSLKPRQVFYDSEIAKFVGGGYLANYFEIVFSDSEGNIHGLKGRGHPFRIEELVSGKICTDTSRDSEYTRGTIFVDKSNGEIYHYYYGGDTNERVKLNNWLAGVRNLSGTPVFTIQRLPHNKDDYDYVPADFLVDAKSGKHHCRIFLVRKSLNEIKKLKELRGKLPPESRYSTLERRLNSWSNFFN